MNDPIKEKLNDILDSCLKIEKMISEVDVSDFLLNNTFKVSVIQDAVLRRITIIGEASAYLLSKHEDFCMHHPELPLIEARGMRNYIVHEYDEIDLNSIWVTAKYDIPELAKSIKNLFINEEKKASV
ncbi:MAG: DUF86 domain-containing protein [Lachnospiraceae bacterium]|nr:DUF86 domain-containing protein [Lachnospiraceae bacterium]